MEGSPSGQVSAVFSFYPLADDPAIGSGSYRMEGTFEVGGRLSFRGTEWIEQPAGYEMIHLDGVVGPADATYSGTIPSCGTFHLTKE